MVSNVLRHSLHGQQSAPKRVNLNPVIRNKIIDSFQHCISDTLWKNVYQLLPGHYLALNLNNSIVLTTPNTFLATANAILYANAKPDFVDINFKTFNIDTINQRTYVFGIAYSKDEKREIVQEAKQIVDLKELVTSILMVSDLSRQRE